MLNKLKVMLFGGKPEKERRRTPRAGSVPKVGAHIARQNLVIKVTDSMRGDLWDWFVLMGWREVSMRNNRRKVVMLPQNTYIQIASANVAERELVYKKIVASQTSS